MNGYRFVSSHPPYVPISLTVRGQSRSIEVEAFIDTGFDGDVLLPPALIAGDTPRLRESRWRLADGSRIVAPSYSAQLSIGAMPAAPVLIIALGNEVLIGRGVTQRFTVTFDHDRRVIVEP